jgi:hypothetical protein
MTSKQYTIRTCDRCGREERTEVATGIPHLWFVLRMSDNLGSGPHWDICPGCTSQVRRFMTNKDNVPPA